jgi:hypothetical protein
MSDTEQNVASTVDPTEGSGARRGTVSSPSSWSSRPRTKVLIRWDLMGCSPV